MKRSFRLRLVVMTVALVAIPLAVVGWRLIDINRGALADAAEAQLTTVVTDLAIAGDRSLDRSEASLRAIAATLTDDARPVEQRIDLAAVLVRSEPGLLAVGIYDGASRSSPGSSSGMAAPSTSSSATASWRSGARPPPRPITRRARWPPPRTCCAGSRSATRPGRPPTA